MKIILLTLIPLFLSIGIIPAIPFGDGLEYDQICIDKVWIENSKEKIPEWIKNNAGWWSDGLIEEEDFLNGIKYLVEKGIIKI